MSARMEKVRKALERPGPRGRETLHTAALAEVEEWETRLAEALRMIAEERGKVNDALADARYRAEAAEAALRALVEEVEMAESIGICLPDRVPALNALQVLTR